jgi:hypothetical protein
MGGPTKRSKSGIANIPPKTYYPCTGGVASLLWSSAGSFIVGGTDHQLKIVDVEKGQIVESIMTQNKVA